MTAQVLRMFFAAAFGLALLLAGADGAFAQGVRSVQIYEYGTYTSGDSVEIGTTPQGIQRSQTIGIKQIETARTIIARLGVQFGFRYRAIGPVNGVQVPVTIVAKFPEPGVLGVKGNAPVVRDAYTELTTTGKEEFLTWTFEMRSDLVPGIWTFEIWSGDKKLAEQSFNIILPPVS